MKEHQLQGTYTVLSPVKLLLVGQACCHTSCLPQPIVGFTVRLICVVIFSSLWSRIPFGVRLVTDWAACTPARLSKSILERVDLWKHRLHGVAVLESFAHVWSFAGELLWY